MLRGMKFGKGSWDRLRSPPGPGQSPGGGPGKLLGFEHLNNVSVNDFEAFCAVFKCIKTCIFYA